MHSPILSAQMVAWSDLGACTNPDCPFKGSFRKFCSPTPMGEITEHVLLLACCICGCRGMQHASIQAPPSAPAYNTPGPAGPSVPGLGASFASAGEAARARKEQQNADLLKDIKTNHYDPANKLHQSSFAKLSSRPDKRKKPATPSTTEPAAKRKPSAAKNDTTDVELTIVLVENTKDVDRGEASTTHRQAKDYKKCVYIAAPRGSENLPYECDQSMDSEESEDFPESPAKSRTPAGKEEPAERTTPTANPAKPSASSAPSQEPKYEVPLDNRIDDAFRLLVNMCRPSVAKVWWPGQTTEPYAGALEAVPMIDHQLHRTQGSSIGALSVDAILSLFEHDLFPQIEFTLDLGDSAMHEKNFRLGAHGLEPIVKTLYYFRRFLMGPLIYLPDTHLKGYVDRVIYCWRRGSENYKVAESTVTYLGHSLL
ncbi:hypothetical protein C8R46DRAFT_1253019 [Mycena filopes]|nr:hypothetical protein C8R46DRAFT_1253019 [Mycena filopes]